MDEKMTHDDLVILTEWMARHHFTAEEVAYAVAKPWKHVDLLELARDDRDPEGLQGLQGEADVEDALAVGVSNHGYDEPCIGRRRRSRCPSAGWPRYAARARCSRKSSCRVLH